MIDEPFEALELFRRTVLSRFTQDLRWRNHREGFALGTCREVTSGLALFVESISKIPDIPKKVVVDANLFLVAYSDWNGQQGDTDDVRALRERKALRLKRKRERLSRAITVNSRRMVHVSWRSVEVMFVSVRTFVEKYPDLFPETSAELAQFAHRCPGVLR